ncbi:MAG: hypothetical protein Q4B67_00690, partial [Eubacteriales bacterium]|nr:hypothetical protein [Eubacteriales bacterium]
GCKDVWNAFMAENAVFGKYDIPSCPTTADQIPKSQVTWEEAKQIHRKHITKGEKDYFVDAFINWNVTIISLIVHMAYGMIGKKP